MEKNQKTKGSLLAFSAFFMWGILPLYWKMLSRINAEEILAHRILWSFVFLLIILLTAGKMPLFIKTLRDRKKIPFLITGALLINFNWFIYIYAINTNNIVQASLGYYINPLFMIFLGMVAFKEKLSVLQAAALLLALTGVIILTANYGRIPWIALLLTLTFGFYGLLKKKAPVDSMVGLASETLFIAPLSLAYIIFITLSKTHQSQTLFSPLNVVLLCGTGVITAVPLLLFAGAAKRIDYSKVGFWQFIGPTVQLFIGIFIFKESFSKITLISFLFIWASMALYLLSLTPIVRGKKLKIAKKNADA